MEIKLWKLRNVSRRLWEEVVALKGAEARTLETTALGDVTLSLQPRNNIH
jgi:hypothetical protein